jgi:hypothetical protein
MHLRIYVEEVVMMYQIEDEPENEFHSDDLVLWHAHDDKHSLPIPGVVVRQLEHYVIIRTCSGGPVKEIAVPPDELVKR